MRASQAAVAAVAAARERARALVAGDRETLTAMHHPLLRWTTHAGAVLDRDHDIAGNTDGGLQWIDLSLGDIDVRAADAHIAS